MIAKDKKTAIHDMKVTLKKGEQLAKALRIVTKLTVKDGNQPHLNYPLGRALDWCFIPGNR